jgi:hypothetical protein
LVPRELEDLKPRGLERNELDMIMEREEANETFVFHEFVDVEIAAPIMRLGGEDGVDDLQTIYATEEGLVIFLIETDEVQSVGAVFTIDVLVGIDGGLLTVIRNVQCTPEDFLSLSTTSLTKSSESTRFKFQFEIHSISFG